MPIMKRLADMARACFALYLVGNVSYGICMWLWRDLMALPMIHAQLGALILKSLLDLSIVALIFRWSRRQEPASRQASGRPEIIGSMLAAAVVAAMAAGAAFGIVKWNVHELRPLQWVYLIGFSAHAAVSEELLCRYLVLDRLGRAIGSPAAFVLQILLFIYLHMFGAPLTLRSMTHIALGATLIGAFYLWTRSLRGAMTLHFCFDVLVGLLFGSSLDGLTIYPVIVGDNYSQMHSHWAGVTVMTGMALWMLWRARVCAPPDPRCVPRTLFHTTPS